MFILGKVDRHGTLVMATAPRIHDTLESAQTEADRLTRPTAMLPNGVTVQVFQLVSTHQPKPKEYAAVFN